MAERLVPHTFPHVPRFEERDIDVLKQRHIVVDGYEIIVHFSRADFGQFYVEALEMTAAHTPFLPMYLVCKVATGFLGGHELRHNKSFKMGRRVYLWVVSIDKRGRPVEVDLVNKNMDIEQCSYEDFDFANIVPSNKFLS